MNQIATIAPSRLPIPGAVAKEFAIQPAQWRVLVEQIFPNAKTVEAVTMALSYCRARNLDIYKKPVHVVPMYSSALGKMVETVWPGIAEIRTTAARTGEYAGIDAVEFGPMIERKFSGTTGKGQYEQAIEKTVRFPEWASVVVYRWVQREKAAFHTKIFWEETYASVGKSDVPNDMWARRPRGQFDKCVEAAALRKAFPEEVGSLYAAEEMEGRVIDHDPAPTPAHTPPRPPSPPSTQEPRASAAARAAEQVVEAEIIDADTGEIVDETTAEPIDTSTYFDSLKERLDAAADEAEVEEVWSEFDPLAKFEGDATQQGIATALKKQRIKAISKGGK